jgi:hypothetical protein
MLLYGKKLIVLRHSVRERARERERIKQNKENKKEKVRVRVRERDIQYIPPGCEQANRPNPHPVPGPSQWHVPDARGQ